MAYFTQVDTKSYKKNKTNFYTLTFINYFSIDWYHVSVHLLFTFCLSAICHEKNHVYLSFIAFC